jgi:hypothetical protein
LSDVTNTKKKTLPASTSAAIIVRFVTVTPWSPFVATPARTDPCPDADHA